MPLSAILLIDPLRDVLHSVLYGLHSALGVSWALSIVALTFVVRIALLPLTIKSKRSMLSMQKLQPYVKQLQQKYKHDRQELNMRMLEFYRDNRVNPMASCLPILVQIPILFALFRLLNGFAKTPPAGDMSFLFGAIPDITEKTSNIGAWGWLLIVFYVCSQMFSSRVMATTADPRQRMLFMVLPLVFVPVVVKFPVGLLVYWITLNLLTLVEHVAIVQLSGSHGPVVLPEDTKGRKKVVTPKGSKPAKTPDGTATKPPARDAPRARRNKRRR